MKITQVGKKYKFIPVYTQLTQLHEMGMHEKGKKKVKIIVNQEGTYCKLAPSKANCNRKVTQCRLSVGS